MMARKYVECGECVGTGKVIWRGGCYGGHYEKEFPIPAPVAPDIVRLIARLWPNGFGPKNAEEIIVFVEEERKCDEELRAALSSECAQSMKDIALERKRAEAAEAGAARLTDVLVDRFAKMVDDKAAEYEAEKDIWSCSGWIAVHLRELANDIRALQK